MSELRPEAFLLWTRALLLGAIALLTGTVAHAGADGLLPSTGVMIALLGVTTVAASWFLHRPASGARVVVLVVAGQTFIHLMLTALAGHRGDPAPGFASPVITRVTAGGSLHGQLMGGYTEPAAAAPSLGWVVHLAHHVAEQGPAMVLAHLAAAMLLGGWLAVGEAALWAVLALTAARVRGWVRAALSSGAGGWVPAHQCRPGPSAARARHVVRRPVLDLGTLSHRGPPALLAL